MESYLDNDFIQQILRGEIDVIEWLSSQDEDRIRSRIYARVPEELDTTVGSYEYDALEPSNIEFAVAYFMLRNIILLAFPQYSFGQWLTLSAAAKGVYRNAAKYATGQLRIQGTNGTRIPKGTKFSNAIPQGSTNKAKYYSTQAEVVIPEEGVAYVDIIADEIGTAGNAYAREISLNIESIKVITSLENEKAITSGIDEEKDESLLERLLDAVRNQSTSGNKKAYKMWAKEVSGVADVDVVPLWNGPGTVKVIIVGNGGKPIPELIAAVKEYLDPVDHEGEGEGCAPVGAVVTVTTVENLIINVCISSLEIHAGYERSKVMEAVKTALSNFVAKISIGGLIRIHDVEDAIKHAAGVLDFGYVLINNSDKNIQSGAHLKPIIGEVIFNE